MHIFLTSSALKKSSSPQALKPSPLFSPQFSTTQTLLLIHPRSAFDNNGPHHQSPQYSQSLPWWL